MDGVLCDELLQEILRRLPPSAYPAASLVSRRWLSLLRSSLSSLSLRLPSSSPSDPWSPPPIRSILAPYSSLTTLALLSDPSPRGGPAIPLPPDAHLLSLSACAASHLPLLRHLRLLTGPVSASALLSLPPSSPLLRLTSLQLCTLRPFSFRWLCRFPSLRELSVLDCGGGGSLAAAPVPPSGADDGGAVEGAIDVQCLEEGNDDDDDEGEEVRGLALEVLSLSGIRPGDHGFGWLWRRCPNLRRLQLRACEGTGDGPAFRSFARCLPNLQEIELRTCRAIADVVLLLIADHCRCLATLILYDGGSRDGLHRFIQRCGPGLRTLDLRLPLDLNNGHLVAVAENFRSLSCLRLQSCCLITGEGLRSLGRAAAGAAIEELVLVNCDVVEREPGLLTFLGQHLRRLRRLDLSHNEMLLDKELGSMLASCCNLVDIRLRGCKCLTDAVVPSIFRFCGLLETVDITRCFGITAKAVEFLILNSPRLRQIYVEASKVSDSASTWASRRVIQVC